MMNILKKLRADAVFTRLAVNMLLFDLMLVLFAWTKNVSAEYLVLIFPAAAVSAAWLISAQLGGCGLKLPVCFSFLQKVGLCLQCVIGKESALKLLVVMVVAAVVSAAAAALYAKHRDEFAVLSHQRVIAVLSAVSLLLYVVLLLFGTKIRGTKAWLTFGGLSVQLTELAKLNAVLFMAYVFTRRRLSEWRRVGIVSAFVAGNALFLLAINELGTLMVILLLYLVMCFLLTDSAKCFAAVAAGTAALAGGIYGAVTMLANSAQERIGSGAAAGTLGNLALEISEKLTLRMDLWLRPETLDKYNEGYQSLMAREAVAIGGLLGSGYKIFLPIAESDYVFPSLILHFGLLIGIAVIIAFFVVLYRGIKIYLSLAQPFEQALCIGCVYCIVMQSFLMIFGSTNFFIMTGIPVAFLSAGGTSAVVTYTMAAFLLYCGCVARKAPGEGECRYR